MRQQFVTSLNDHLMMPKTNVRLLLCDLGYPFFDLTNPNIINVGAREQAAVDMAVGMALDGLIPFVYSITPFILWRPAEAIRLYLNHEKIPVILVGVGVGNDYSKEDGFTHDAGDVDKFMAMMPNIHHYKPTKDNIASVLDTAIQGRNPAFIQLGRY